jgi:predicted nuclease of restriction endonuclease-like RecB superfamily
MLKEMLGFAKPAKVKNIEYETERLRYILEKWYVPDFIITRKDGSKIYIETKGYFRPDDRAKLLATRDNNPGVDIRLVFMVDNKLNKNAKMKYSGWAEKHNFTYSIGHVPFDWFKV